MVLSPFVIVERPIAMQAQEMCRSIGRQTLPRFDKFQRHFGQWLLGSGVDDHALE
jgi:hypothetical protein